jgi:uncharacterized membrane protein (DUF2068 family)
MVHGPANARAPRGDRWVLVIGVFRLVKSVLLAAFGVGALVGVPEAIVRAAVDALRWVGALWGHGTVRPAIVRLLSLDNREVRELAIACLAYAAVFAIEGAGLIRRRRWAEWLTVVVTGSFIPFEVYELVRRAGPGKIVALILNVAIVVYLAWRRYRDIVRR